jgi:ribonuclease G
MTTILAACGPGEVRVAAVESGDLLDYAIWRPGAPDGVGDIRRGRITARVPALAGAFVALDGAEGFLPDTEGARNATEGAAVSVRVTRAAQGGKGPRLAVVSSETAPRCGPGAVERLAALHPKADIRVDDPTVLLALRPVLGARVALVRAPVFDTGLEGEIEALADASVTVPGGGRLSVYATPALTAIDIDAAGASAWRAGKTATHLAVNAAALPVLARQIRLRNLSGAIMVDWAGLPARKRASLGPALVAALASDPLRPRLLGFTNLGLAEIVRTRVHPPLHEMLAGPHAAGLAGLRRLVADAAAAPGRALALRAAPSVANALAADPAAQADVARLTGRELLVRADTSFGTTRWSIEIAS